MPRKIAPAIINHCQRIHLSVIPCFLFLSILLFTVTNVLSLDNPSPSKNTVAIATTQGYPVVFASDTLFYIYSNLGPFTPQERANAIINRLDTIISLPAFDPNLISIKNRESLTDILYEDTILLTVTDEDASAQHKSRTSIADTYQDILQFKLNEERDNRSLRQTLTSIGLGLMVIIGLALTIFLINLLFKKLIIPGIKSQKGKTLQGIRIKDYSLLSPERQTELIVFISKIFRLVIILVMFYGFLTFLFGIFPATRGIAMTLWTYIVIPVNKIFYGFFYFVPNLLTILVIILVTWCFIRIIRFFAHEIEKGDFVIEGFYADWAMPTYNLIRILALLFMLIVIYPYLPGSDSPVFRGATIFFGVLVSLGSTSAVSDIIAGVVITYMRPFQIGDRVKIGDITGDVMEKTMLVIRIHTIKNENVTIPNSTVMNQSTVNYSSLAREKGLILHTTVTIGYDVAWRKVYELLINAAINTSSVQSDPKPYVLQTALNDFYVSYQLNVYINDPLKMSRVYSELHQNIQDQFNQAKIEILSPHYRAFRDGSSPVLPETVKPDTPSTQ